jgi:pyruvate/2-oxoglutarate dehydrogenase complex dihydrolipoamide acyltransferase (E2) component
MGGGARLVILVPMPRYVRNPCCDDGGHVTNQGEKEFYEEFLSAEKRLLDAAAAGDRTREAKVIDLCKLFGSAETPLQELTTPDGTSVWAGDGVHLTSPAYRVAARLIAAELERSAMGEAGEPANKRQRLESVVPAPAPPPVKPAAKAAPVAPKPVAPPLWLSGQLPASQKSSNSRDNGYGRDYGGGRGGGGRGGSRGNYHN